MFITIMNIFVPVLTIIFAGYMIWFTAYEKGKSAGKDQILKENISRAKIQSNKMTQYDIIIDEVVNGTKHAVDMHSKINAIRKKHNQPIHVGPRLVTG